MSLNFRLVLDAPDEDRDRFFLWSMVILPIVGECAYIFDSYYYLLEYSEIHSYLGLLSTILVVFTYLRYCVPIKSTKILAIYYVILCILNEIGSVACLFIYIRHRSIYNIVIYIGWILLEIIMTSYLIYYRVVQRCQPSFHVESKHLFSFISRLEVILAIFIPFFSHNFSTTLTKHSIAFFLLFDFFSDSYSRFLGFWIKSVLYLFVCTVTVCVATEWISQTNHNEIYDIISSSFEFISACLCDLLIIFQFIPYHLRSIFISKIAREGWTFHQLTEKTTETIEIITHPSISTQISKETIIELKS